MQPLLDDEQVYFLHIEKTAGLSLTSFLDNQFPANTIYQHHYRHIPSLPREQMAEYRLIRGHYTYALHTLLPRKPRYITMLRDPIARVISHYQHALRDPSYYLYNHVHSKDLSLLDFVLDPTTHHVASNWQTRCVALDTDLGNLAQQCPEEIFDQCIDSVATTLPNDEILEIAKQHLDEFMFVGITERFEESLAILTYLLGSAPAYAPRINVAPKTLSQTEAPLETRKVIAEHNQLDLALYEDAIGRFQVQFNEMLNDLLLSNYYQKWRTTSVYNIDYTFDQALNGSGWHDREQVEKNRYFRWTGLEDEATLLFNVSYG